MVALCIGCLQSLCDACIDQRANRDLCDRCAARRRAQRSRRRRAITIASLTTLSIAALGTLGAARYVKHHVIEGVVRTKEAALEENPCGRDAIVELVKTQVKQGNARAAVVAADAFLARCGSFPQLARHTFGAHMQLHEYDRAAADASVLIGEDPEDKDYRWWRGQAHEQAGALEKAAADYQYAISIQPRLKYIPMDLATVYEKMKRPCDAVFTLEQYAQRYPTVRSDEAVQRRMQRLDSDGGCGRVAGVGRALIRFPPGSHAIFVTARIDGRASSRLVVDTGATMVVITRKLAASLGIAYDERNTILVGTAGGIREAQVITLQSIDVQGVSATSIPAAVSDELPPGVDGLLGLSFLSRFSMYLDESQGKLELSARSSSETAPESSTAKGNARAKAGAAKAAAGTARNRRRTAH